MKHFLILAFFSVLVLQSTEAFSQNQLDELVIAESEAALRDTRKLVEGYMNPFMKALGVGMANGWYNTAKAHKSFGVDITATVNAARIPEKDLFYNIADLNLERITLESVDGDYSATAAPTVFGPEAEVQYRYTNPGTGDTEVVAGPGGLGLKDEIGYNMVPVPMVNMGLGIVKNTDLKIRFVPTIAQDDFEFNMWGVGVMHEVKQYLPVAKKLPFDLSGFVGYTSLNFKVALSDDPAHSDQVATLDASALTVQGLISKKFSVLTVYGGLGYNRVNTELNMLGEYTVKNENNEEVVITDPIKNMGFPVNGPRITAGMRLKLLILTLHADYTIQEYSTLTVGVGLNVR